jgi:phosphoribosylformylglycinamidine synthase II
MNNKIGIIRYPGSNCDRETFDYFNTIFSKKSCFYIWHTCDDIAVLENVKLLVLPGGFAFGDRIYDKATEQYKISPGTMAINSPVSKIICEAANKNITILGICNGFQILTQMNLLPGKLVLGDSKKFICDKRKCIVNNSTIVDLCIANSHGKYISDKNNDYIPFLMYDNGEIAGISNSNKTIVGMMPHPERNDYKFRDLLIDMLFKDTSLTVYYNFDKAVNDLMFSEHISYKTTRRYLSTLHTKENWVVQGPGENAGIVDIGKSSTGESYCITIRIESHNHPTFINPFEGAATGVGGILRDIFTMGSRPIGVLDFLRFGTDENSYRLSEGAIKGISYYGNCIGVPNIGGDFRTHESYNTNPLVNVACLGLVKKKNIIYGNALNEDSYLIYVGGKTGNEGINGAAMASNSFVDSKITKELESNVQTCDPYLGKLLLEACCEISDNGLAEGMQDMGAGGLLCASMEVVKRGIKNTGKNLGCDIFLDKVPTKCGTMEHKNILISESQERMLIVCQEHNLDKINTIFKKWDLEYSIIGKTNLSGNYNVLFNNKLLYQRDLGVSDDIHDYSNTPLHKFNQQNHSIPARKIKNMSKWKVYDSTVGNRTIKGPDKPGSYAILNIPEVNKQLVLSWGETFDECHDIMKRFVGVKPLCLVNCLNFGDPKYSLYDIEDVINDLNTKCREFRIPIVGGNVSLYNTTAESSIRPTPILVMLGIS